VSAFFPETDPFDTGRLDTADGHSLFWQRCGNPEGTPLIVLHGGPGSGCAPKFRTLFDPDRFHVILLDQRGAGQSTPHISLENNTTAHLIGDVEQLREQFGIERWVVFGPSWGSTLALAYAETHPERVRGLVVEAIFLGTNRELDWWHSEAGAPRFFPDAWADFVAPIPADQRTCARSVLDWCFNAMQAELAEGLPILSQLDTAEIETLRGSTLYRWTEYEDRLSYLNNPPDAVLKGLREKGTQYITAHSLIEAHYFRNKCFLDSDQLIRDAGKLADIPMAILHSRYDMVCPAESAFRLAEACPHADFVLVPVNGHGLTEAAQASLNAIMKRLLHRI